MRKLIFASVLVVIATLPVLAGEKKQCEISCDPQYQQADKELNQTWKSLKDIERNALRPAQRNWIKYRDNTCKNDNCLTKVTQQRTEYLQSVKTCTNNGGGLSCFEGK
jgi:uncharacterized protein YecT (DUF1311 family)